MTRDLILAGAIFTLGVAIGAYVINDRDRTIAVSAPPVEITTPHGAPNRNTSAPARDQLSEAPTAVPEIPDKVADALIQMEDHIGALASGHDRLQRELADLWQRMTMLENGRFNPVYPPSNADDNEPQANMPVTTSQQRHDALTTAGLSLSEADRILRHESELDLAQLELRDRAARDGWLRSERYRDERHALQERQLNLRTEVGDQVYDRYLFVAGRDNRLKVNSVILGSVAESAGLASGDVIVSYDGARVFTIRDLNSLTTAGTRSDLVSVSVLRDGQLVQNTLPRGPLGVQVDGFAAEPDG